METVKNKTVKNNSVLTLCMCGLFAALCGVGAFIRIPVPVCPFTLQYLFTMMAGLLLGEKKGAFSVGAYVFCGLAGLPIFTEGGGIGYIFQPTFGYLLGFIAGAFITGKIANSVQKPSVKRIFLANLAGLAAVYAFGMIYYYIIQNFYVNGEGIGVWPLILYCFILAVPGDLVLCAIGALLGKRLIPLTRKYR